MRAALDARRRSRSSSEARSCELREVRWRRRAAPLILGACAAAAMHYKARMTQRLLSSRCCGARAAPFRRRRLGPPTERAERGAARVGRRVRVEDDRVRRRARRGLLHLARRAAGGRGWAGARAALAATARTPAVWHLGRHLRPPPPAAPFIVVGALGTTSRAAMLRYTRQRRLRVRLSGRRRRRRALVSPPPPLAPRAVGRRSSASRPS